MAERPMIEVQLGATSIGSKVLVNGEDISHLIRGVQIACRVGEPTKLTLEAAPGVGRATLKAALDAEQVEVI